MKQTVTVPLYVLLVFLSGILVGSVGYRLYSTKSASANVPAASRPRNPEEFRRKIVEEMRNRLKLSNDQVAKLNGIYDATHQRYLAYDQHSKQERKQIRDQHIQEIRSILNDNQRAEYDKMIQERERRHQEMEKKGEKGRPTS